MKKYNIEWLTVARHKPLTRATKTKPFPGKYPTRIAWSVKGFDGKRVSYVGKPSRRSLQRYRTHLRGAGYLGGWAIEFDRNGLIAKDGGRPGTLTNAGVRATYHPVTADLNTFFTEPGRWITYHDTMFVAAAAALQRVKRRMYWPMNTPPPAGATE